LAKTFRFINAETLDFKDFKTKKEGCLELGLDLRLIDATKESYRETYDKLTDIEKSSRINPRYSNNGYFLEVIKDKNENRVVNICGEDYKVVKMKDGAVVEKEGVAGYDDEYEEDELIYIEDKDFYTIIDGVESLKISKERVREILNLYCTLRFTKNKVANSIGMDIEDLKIVMRTFDINHDSIPFLDEDIEDMTSDEMIKKSVANKKESFYKNFVNIKNKELEKEVAIYREKNYLYDKLFDKISNIEFKPIIFHDFKNPVVKTDSTVIISLADVHSGTFTDNYYNKYSTPIMRERFKEFTVQALEEIKKVKPNRIIVLNLGDSVEGIIGESGRIATDCDSDTATENVTEEIGNLLLAVSKYAKVDFYQTMGNHGRKLRDKRASIPQENVENTINWGLKLLLKSNSNIKIHKNGGVVEFAVYDKNIAIHHGDNVRNDQKMTSNRGKKYRMVFKGHNHKFDIDTINELESITVGCMMGSNDWSSDKELFCKPMQLITVVEKDWGKVKHIPVYFD